MSFQSPAALLLLAAVPLAALLLGRGLRRRTRRLAAFPLLAGLVDGLPLLPRSHLLRRRLQLLLFLGALACAGAAGGGPILGADADPARHAVIVVDDLALWRDAEGRPEAWQRLLGEAARVAGRYRSDDRLFVVRSGEGLVGDAPLAPRRAAALVRALRPALHAPDPEAAAALAAALAGARDGTQVHVVTPDPARWAPALAGRGAAWQVVAAAPPVAPGANHALLDVDLRPDFFTPGRVALFCRVGSFGGAAGGAAPLTLRVTRDGVALAERAFALAPGETRGELFPELDAGTGVLRVEVGPRDAFPDDDLFLAPLRARPALALDLVTEGNAPLEAALRAIPGVDLAVTRAAAGRGDAGRIRVFDRTPPPDDDRGAQLVIAPPQGMPGVAYRGDAIDLREVRPGGAAALLRGVATSNLRPRRLPVLVLPGDFEQVLTADGHPLVAVGRSRAGARLALVAFDPAESGWTRDPSFPILVANLVAWLGEGSGETRSSLLVGERLPPALVPAVRGVSDPAGHAAAEPPGGWGDFRFPLPGAWRVRGTVPEADGEVLVNLLDERLSAVMAAPATATATGSSPEPRPFRADVRGPLLAAAIALLVLERIVAPRRPAGRLA